MHIYNTYTKYTVQTSTHAHTNTHEEREIERMDIARCANSNSRNNIFLLLFANFEKWNGLFMYIVQISRYGIDR